MSEKKVRLQIRHLKKMFSAHEGVEDISFDVYDHELLTLLGPSGCGKTTILRCIGGFHALDAGQILLDGKDISGLPPEQRPTNMVFQGYNLWPHMSVMGNMEFALKLKKVPEEERKRRIHQMLELVHMDGMEKKYPSQLSGGQQQRVAIARALVQQPSVLLMDEPFSALDAKIRASMRDELRRIQQETELTIIFVTHDQEEAMAISDRIAVIHQGVIQQIDTPAEIYNHPKSMFVASFIGDMNFIPENGKYRAVRPEDMILKQNGSQGEILSVMMLGHYARIRFRDNATGQEYKAFLPKENSQAYRTGMRIDYTYEHFVELNQETQA